MNMVVTSKKTHKLQIKVVKIELKSKELILLRIQAVAIGQLHSYRWTDATTCLLADGKGTKPKFAQATQMGKHLPAGHKLQHHVQVAVVLQHVSLDVVLQHG